MQRSIVWKGLDADTDEVCLVSHHGEEITVRSEITGWAEGVPVSTEYFMRLDDAWNVLEFEVKTQTGLEEKAYAMKFENGIWKDAGGERPEFSGCRFIDITLTPLTNTLPINNLDIPMGETHKIEVVYIDVLEHSMKKDTQWYTRLSQNTYNFKNAFGFSADIVVDGEGFVTDYPQLFKMI